MIFSHVLYQLSYLGTGVVREQECLLRRSPEDEGEELQYTVIPLPQPAVSTSKASSKGLP